jgi:hypothetical protein
VGVDPFEVEGEAGKGVHELGVAAKRQIFKRRCRALPHRIQKREIRSWIDLAEIVH